MRSRSRPVPSRRAVGAASAPCAARRAAGRPVREAIQRGSRCSVLPALEPAQRAGCRPRAPRPPRSPARRAWAQSLNRQPAASASTSANVCGEARLGVDQADAPQARACRSPRRRRAAAPARGAPTCAGRGRRRGSPGWPAPRRRPARWSARTCRAPTSRAGARVSRPSSRSRSRVDARAGDGADHAPPPRRAPRRRRPRRPASASETRSALVSTTSGRAPLSQARVSSRSTLASDRQRVQRDHDRREVDVGAQHLAVALLAGGRPGPPPSAAAAARSSVSRWSGHSRSTHQSPVHGPSVGSLATAPAGAPRCRRGAGRPR